ncbi:GNAT family N-acetyltransferase [Rhizobium sp. LjRoot254]|uniref:GNAT family N-acetyltransferase n=1 Tax=Rhizobium sp. LjRoot254 TaxID=3342297 RepID=UPI003ED03D35
MSGYFGTELQQRLQAQAESSADFIRATPGACQNGRMMGCDDLDKIGWERITAFLDRDGVCGFRLFSPSKADEARALLAERDFRLDTWDVFVADRATGLAASEAIVARGLPDGLVDLEAPTDPTGEHTARIQSLIGGAGVVPFSGSLLVGEFDPATTVAVGDQQGNVVAAAHGYMPHNADSVFHKYAWGGLVAVAESARGKGLGNYINARMVTSVFRDLGAAYVYELVSASNATSRRMVEACGLRHRPDLISGAAARNDAARHTR